jgi:hypothetical protein
MNLTHSIDPRSPVRSGTAAYYRPPSVPGLTIQGVAPAGAPKFVVYPTPGSGQMPPTSVYATVAGSSSPAPRPGSFVSVQFCTRFLGTTYQNGKVYENDQQTYQKAVKYI